MTELDQAALLKARDAFILAKYNFQDDILKTRIAAAIRAYKEAAALPGLAGRLIEAAIGLEKRQSEWVETLCAAPADREALYAAALLREAAAALSGVPFQGRVFDWLLACFGGEIARDHMERNHRFLEEALELVQACGCTASEAHQLVDYTFGRPIGEKVQEVGGALVTLSALCSAQGIDMAAAGETELARIWTMVEKIRAKQAAKPRHSPLPAAPDTVKP